MNKEVEILKKSGLTDYEARAYNGLIHKKFFTATELSKFAEIPRIKTYQVLESLKTKGMCEEIMGKVKKYIAVDPKLVFPKLIKEIEQQERNTKKLYKSYEQLFKAHKDETDNSEFVNILTSKKSILDNLEKKQLNAKSTVHAFVKKPYIMNVTNLEETNPSQETQTLKGITYKGLYEIEYNDLGNFIKMIEFFERMGEEVKVIDKLPLKFFIFDKNDVLITLKKAINNQLTAMSIEHGDLALTLMEIYDLYWEKAETINEFKLRIKKDVN
ncbi:MAG: TrmB family transcriptional regulator [Hyphomicrobiales bacterium]